MKATHAHNMTDAQKITVGLLAAIAVVLTAMLVLTWQGTSQDEARAEMSVRGGATVITTGRVAPNVDLVYVLDIQTRKVIGYSLDSRTGQMRQETGVDLAKSATFNRQ